MAASIIELATLPREIDVRLVYNLCSPRTFSWTNDFLPALSASGLKFDTTSFDEWISELKKYDSSHSTQVAIEECPAVKLIDFYETTYGKKQQGSVTEFDTSMAQRDSPSIRSAPDVIKSGLVATMLQAWLKKWSPGQERTNQQGKRKIPSSSLHNGRSSSRLRSR